MRLIPVILLLYITTILSGCGAFLKSNYQRPIVKLPEHWNTHTTNIVINTSHPWWHIFRDPQLNTLIDKALQKNNNLAIAALKVQKARLQANLEDTKSIPGVLVETNSEVLTRLNTHSDNIRHYNAYISLNYTFDLWGRIARLQDIANWEAQATELDRQHVKLELIALTAGLYWHIAYLNKKITIIEQSIDYTKKVLDLVRVRYRMGAVSRLDEASAQKSLIAQQTALMIQIEHREKLRNALAILFDQAPQYREIERSHLSMDPLPDIPAGLPVEILARRPDLKAAEARLYKSLSQFDETKVRFYPVFNLTGKVGVVSDTLTTILKNPMGFLLLNGMLPFVEWNTYRLTTKIAQLEYEQAVIQFRQTLYKALVDVENALLARTRYINTAEQYQHELEQAIRIEKISEIRYRMGKTSIKEWLDQQDVKRLAELVIVENRYHQLVNLAKLYQALGGEPVTEKNQ